MPRAALLSIHARVEGTGPSTWEDPSLVQLWGPRYNVFVVAERDLAVFSLGTLPEDARGLRRAEDLAVRLNAVLGGDRMTYGQAGHALGVHPNSLRYAAATGTVLIRWEGARLPTIWTVPRPEISARDARIELARRYLHIYGPTTSGAFGKWAGISQRSAALAFEALGGSLTPVRTPVGDAWILTRDEAAFRTAPPARRPRAAAAERRRLFPPVRGRPRAPGRGPRPPRRALDAPGLAWRPPPLGEIAGTWRRHGRRCRPGGGYRARNAKRSRRNGVPAAARHRRAADRRPLGRLKRVRPPGAANAWIAGGQWTTACGSAGE